METYLRNLPALLRGSPLEACAGGLADAARSVVARHGRAAEWTAALAALPLLRGDPQLRLDRPCVTVEGAVAGNEGALAEALQRFHPWRKGPFCIHGVHIDSEWRSDWKWARVEPHLSPLRGRRVLDVGCGNGYYGWRMLGAGADEVIGLDPTVLYFAQFLAIRRYLGETRFQLVPVGIEALPAGLRAFDTLFSMGVLYHRRDPLGHLAELHSVLRPGGELVLESLVIKGGAEVPLRPAGRYAKMKNVHAIPSVPLLLAWLQEAGFSDCRCVDLTPTTPAEQRATEWMRFESLCDFLDPADPNRTVEGEPAPLRAVVVARVPGPDRGNRP